MLKNKILLVFVAFLLVFLPYSVKADCNTCDPSKCEECGCVLKSDKCVYANYESDYKSCGNKSLEKIPSILPKITSVAYTIIKIAVPILLVVFGSLDLVKGIMAAKDDDIKKGQQILIKRLIAGALVFFVFVVVQFAVSILADSNKNTIIDCARCFIEGRCD